MQNSIQEHEPVPVKDDMNAAENAYTSKPEPKDLQLWHKMLYTFLVTLPVLGLGAVGCSNFSQLTDQLVYIKYGGQLGNTSELNTTCTVSLNKSGEDHAQASASEFRLYSRMGRCAAAFIFLPFWGSRTDQFGRHIGVIAGTVAALMYTIPLLLVVLIDAVPLWVLIIGDVMNGAFGSSTKLLLLTCAAFTADVFPEGYRILMMIFVEMVLLLAWTLGQVGGGYWIQASGFVPIVISMLVIHVIVLLYGILVFPKLARPYDHRTSKREGTSRNSNIMQYFIMTYKIMAKRREGYARAYLLLTMIVVFVMHFSIFGVSSVFNIYVIGPPLCWNSVFLGIFNGVNSTLCALSPVILGVIFMKSSRKATVWLVLAAIVSDLLHTVIFGFASTSLMMFVSIFLGSLQLLVAPGSRTIIADLVNAEEEGAALAGYTVCTVLAEFLANPLFNSVFVATLATFNTCVFYMAASFDVVALVFLGLYGCIKLKQKKVQYQTLVTTEVK